MGQLVSVPLSSSSTQQEMGWGSTPLGAPPVSCSGLGREPSSSRTVQGSKLFQHLLWYILDIPRVVVFIASSDYKSLLQCHGTRFHYRNEDKRTYSQWAPDLLHAAKSGTDSHAGGQIPGAHMLDSQGCSTLTSVYLFLIHMHPCCRTGETEGGGSLHYEIFPSRQL